MSAHLSSCVFQKVVQVLVACVIVIDRQKKRVTWDF